MKLSDLSAGQKVIVQMLWGSSEQDIATQIIQAEEDSLLLESFTFKGNPVDLSSGSSPDVEFGIFCTDPADGTRKFWKDMAVSDETWQGRNCYRFRLRDKAAAAETRERRREVRMTLDIPGVISLGKDREPVPITIHDISSIGISLLVPADFPVGTGTMDIVFSDIVNNDAFMIPLKCKAVRQVLQPRDLLGFGRGTVLCGCTIEAAGESLMTYILVKRSSLTERP